jgi:hypothetical protein
MHSSAELSILLDIAELTKRYGMRPSDADAALEYDDSSDEPLGGVYVLRFDGITKDSVANYDKMAATLGCNDNGQLRVSGLRELEEIVERALSLAPRSRKR